jgi:membrane-bound ClpP family serine protease
MARATLFMGAGWGGLLGIALVLANALIGLPGFVAIAGGMLVIACGVVMLLTRNADEYTRGLWSAGASLAFIALLVLSVGLPFVEGVYDGLRGYETSGREMPAQFGVTIAIAAFFVGQAWKRLLGDS